MKRAVFCTVAGKDIQPIIDALRSRGISNTEISLLVPQVEGLKNADLLPDAIHGVETGAIVGGATGGLASVASLLIEGLGAFVAAGPVATLFAGAVAGSLMGGLTAATGDLGRLVGIPGEVANHVEKQLDAGRGLVFVHYRTDDHKTRAVDVFRQFDATDIETTADLAQAHGEGA